MTEAQTNEMINQVSSALQTLDPEVQQNLLMSMGALIGMLILYAIAWAILGFVAGWKMFKKAGQPGWKIFIPVYNVIVLFKISGVTPWLALALIVFSGVAAVPNPIVVLISLLIVLFINIYLCYKLSKSFGKGIGYTLGLIFFNNIFYLILGLGDTKYVGAGGKTN